VAEGGLVFQELVDRPEAAQQTARDGLLCLYSEFPLQ